MTLSVLATLMEGESAVLESCVSSLSNLIIVFAIHLLISQSTACACAVVGHSKVICCNAGDSRAIIVKRDGSFVPLSHDHKPGRNDETKRINDLGGRVIYWGRWRVEGVLAVSRSIGDAKLKPYVTASPDIIEHEIGEF